MTTGANRDQALEATRRVRCPLARVDGFLFARQRLIQIPVRLRAIAGDDHAQHAGEHDIEADRRSHSSRNVATC